MEQIMQKITGIKSVDFKITAYGHGVVNWNGSTAVRPEGADKDLNNHSMPKLRGYNNLTGKKSEKGFAFKKDPRELNFDHKDPNGTPLYISQNCIRHHLFREQAYDQHFADKKAQNVLPLLCSFTGLIRGYVIPSTQLKRTSPLLLEDFVDVWGKGNFEQLSNSSSIEEKETKDGIEYKRGENSIFSKITFGDTKYIAYGSISIEQLQFISLENKFDRCAMIIKDNQGEKIAQQIQDFIASLDNTRTPKATFHANYVRKGSIYKQGEVGILLDEVAIDILVNTTLDLIRDLAIRQAKGYMYVDEIEVDYNDSSKMMRIKRTGESCEKSGNYAVYFQAENP